MTRQMAFVLSDMRSGSTLLDQLLGAHPDIMSLGELHWLPAYVTQDRSIYDPDHELVCTCGRTVNDCVFWSQVARTFGRPLDSLHLRPIFSAAEKRLLERLPRAFRYEMLQDLFVGTAMVKDTLALAECLFEVSGRSNLVDSSKSTFRFRAIYDSRHLQTRGLILTRDYRAVVHSKMKRGHTLESAAKGWRSKMSQISALTDDLPRAHIFQLSYESLCEDPAGVLTRLCEFLQLQFAPVMLERPTCGTHHIGGSPSKFDQARVKIERDRSYENAFSTAELSLLAKLVGGVAERWGY